MRQASSNVIRESRHIAFSLIGLGSRVTGSTGQVNDLMKSTRSNSLGFAL